MNHSSKHLRVVVFISSLGAGGAERVAVRICDWLSNAGHKVFLLTLSPAHNDFYSYDDRVERIELNSQNPSRNWLHAIWNNFRRLYSLRSVIRAHRVDVVLTLGAASNVLMLLALIGVRCRKIISERNDPVRQPLSLSWHLLRKIAYPMAALHVSQSHYVSDWILRRFPKLSCEVIGNTAGHVPFEAPPDFISMNETGAPIKLLAVSRLTHQKGLDLLLPAFAMARSRSAVPIELVVLGDGEDRAALLAQVDALDLHSAVKFLGKARNVWDHMKAAQIFVLSSRLEGFPNSLIEAMAFGLPTIAARCQGGVEDVLGEVPGLYALEFAPGDVEALADAIVTLAAAPALRQRLSAAARERALNYSPEQIGEKWLRAVEG